MANGIGLLSDQVEENSIFHTNKPRDTKTKIHLVLVFMCFLSSLAIAIFLAETGGGNFPLAAQENITKKDDTWIYGKSE